MLYSNIIKAAIRIRFSDYPRREIEGIKAYKSVLDVPDELISPVLRFPQNLFWIRKRMRGQGVIRYCDNFRFLRIGK